MNLTKYIFILLFVVLFSGCGGNSNSLSYSNYNNFNSTPKPNYPKQLNLINTTVYRRNNIFGNYSGKIGKRLYNTLLASLQGSGLKVFANVSMDSLFFFNDPDAKRTLVSAKKVDFCITDAEYNPIAIVLINVHGGEHLTIKRQLSEKVGIKVFEIYQNDFDNLYDVINNRIISEII